VSGKMGKTQIFNIILIIFGCICYYLASDIYVVKDAERLGPDFWPKTFSAVIVIVSAIDLLVAFFKKEKEPSKEELIQKADTEESKAPEKTYPILLVLGILATAIYIYLQDILGFTISTVLYLASIMIIGRYRKAKVIIASSLIGTFIVLFAFTKIAFLALPAGTGIFADFTYFLYKILGVR
jgi:putative tricarboxylic transport membrane protein